MVELFKYFVRNLFQYMYFWGTISMYYFEFYIRANAFKYENVNKQSCRFCYPAKVGVLGMSAGNGASAVVSVSLTHWSYSPPYSSK